MDAQHAGPQEQDRAVDEAIMMLLLDSTAPWSTEEIGREIGDEIATVDGLARLCRCGLIHRLDKFVFATRSARHAFGLSG